MSDNTEKNNSFKDSYHTDNLDDSELQARLYAEIYYESNIECESGTTDASRIIKLDNMAIERNVESKRTQHELEEHSLASKIIRADSQKTPSTEQSEFIQVDTLASKEMNSAYREDNESLEDISHVQGEESKENSSKKFKSFKQKIFHAKNASQEISETDNNDTAYSKYNVVSKCLKLQQKENMVLTQQTDKDEDSSDSEESIFEVPVPPKPQPLLIDLQESDEENDSNSGIDKNDLKKCENNDAIKTNSRMSQFRNCELEILQDSHQDKFSKSKNSVRSHNKYTMTLNENIQTLRMQNVTEDIALNCINIPIIQKSTKNIREIKQLSKTGINQQSKSTENISQNSKKMLPQTKSKGNNKNAHLQQETPVTSGKKLQIMQQNVNKSSVHNVYNFRHKEQNKRSEIKSSNPVIDRKRQCNNNIDNQPKQKRPCIIQQNNQDLIPQGNNTGEKRNEFFEPMTEEMKNYYNLSRGQENFDIGELQRGMSKDPQMWTILDEDLMPCPSSKRTRFWNIKCTNCHQDGHQRYKCPTPRRPPCCYMCGMKDHTEFQCPEKICLTCGHEQTQCPDLWRRYHQTIDMTSVPQDPGNVMKPSRLLYCCNCAKRGHESSTCREYRWSEHFPTPAVVTNYTDGPTYPTPYVSSSSDPKIGFSLSEAEENEISIPQNVVDIQQTTEDVESFVNLDILSNIDFGLSQEAEYTSQAEGNLKSSLIWPTVETKLKPTKVNRVSFSNIICSYGILRNKDARMILMNLDTFFGHRRYMIKNLMDHKSAPNFLKILLEKAIQFELTIGFTNYYAIQILTLQLIAMKEYIEHLYDLLIYWFDLPEDEKIYGIEVILPVNPKKMFNVLQERVKQLKRKCNFMYNTDINTYIINTQIQEKNVQLIYRHINKLKNELKQHKEQQQKKKLHKMMCRLQTKLLMSVNTEPQPNAFVCTFKKEMKRFESKKNQMNERVDVVTYLKFILLYNNLFVPHTSRQVYERLEYIEFKEKKNNDLLQMQRELETYIGHIPTEQENLVYTSSATSCTAPNINFENFTIINNEILNEKQNMNDTSLETATSCIPPNINLENSIINEQNNEILDEKQNMNDISFETSKITNCNYDEIRITIKNSFAQDPQITPLNIELMSVQSEDPEKNESQLPTNEVRIDSNVSANKQDININNTIHTSFLSKKQRKKRLKEERDLNDLIMILKKDGEIPYENTNLSIYDIATRFIRKARAFNTPYMINAADEAQRQINDQRITLKHIKTLHKLIKLEQIHQKKIRTCCNSLK